MKALLIATLLLIGLNSFASENNEGGEWVKIYETTEKAFDFYSYSRLYDRHSNILERNPPVNLSYATVTISEYEYLTTDEFCHDAFKFRSIKSSTVCEDGSEEGEAGNCSAVSRGGLDLNPCRN